MRASTSLIALTLTVSFAAQPVSANDKICKELKRFSEAKFTSTEKPEGRRWVEFHWGGDWAGPKDLWAVACKQASDEASKQFCSYLIDNSSREFSAILPMRILTCYGYQFPHYRSWSNWHSDIELWEDERLMLLEVRFAGIDSAEHAIRLSVFDDSIDETIAELPPIKPFNDSPGPKE